MTDQEIRQLRTRLVELEAELQRIKDDCPKYNSSAVCRELDELCDEVRKLRREMHDVASRLAAYEEVTGRFFLLEDDE
jgi:chromosome segregation ATPase